MNTFTFRLLLALVGLIAFVALLISTIILAYNDQPVWAAFTGSGAVAVGLGGLYRLLLTLGQQA